MDKFIHFMWLQWNLPAGSIWSNLQASIVWGLAAYVLLKVMKSKLIDSLDGRIDGHLSCHRDDILKHVDRRLREHHEQIKEEINVSEKQLESSTVQHGP